jgi:hypothetical protein
VRTFRGARPVVAALFITGSLAWAVPGQAADPPMRCDTSDLDAIAMQVQIARTADEAGDRALLLAAVKLAREDLGRIAEACGPVATPVPATPLPVGPAPSASAAPSPSALPADLGVSATLGRYTFRRPADLIRLEEVILRPIDQAGVTSQAVTYGDSAATGDLLGHQLTAVVPDTFRVIGVAIGDPGAALASVGLFDPSQPVPPTVVGALQAVGDRAASSSADSSVPLVVHDARPMTFPGGEEGAIMTMDFTDSDGALLAQGGFAVRPLASGDWALGVGLASQSGFDRIGDELGRTLASIEEG